MTDIDGGASVARSTSQREGSVEQDTSPGGPLGAVRRDWTTTATLAIAGLPVLGTVVALGVIRPAYVAYYHGLGLQLTDVGVSGLDVAGYTLGVTGFLFTFIVLMALTALAVVRLDDRFLGRPVERLIGAYQESTTSQGGEVGLARRGFLLAAFACCFYSPLALSVVPFLLLPPSDRALLLTVLLLGISCGGLLLALKQVSNAQAEALRHVLLTATPMLVCIVVIVLTSRLQDGARDLAYDIRTGNDSTFSSVLEVQATRVLVASRGKDPLGLCSYDAVASRVARSGDTIYLVIRGREHRAGSMPLSPVVPVRAEDYDVIDVDAQRSLNSHSLCVDSVGSA